MPMLILADDLTGAMDAAAPFAARGLEAVVGWAPMNFSAAEAAVISVSTSTREGSESEAAGIVGAEITRWRERFPDGACFKKIDSTMRGHVAAETLATFDTGKFEMLVVCPALPRQSRIVRDGHVLVHGEPADIWAQRGSPDQAVRALVRDHFTTAADRADIVLAKPGDAIELRQRPTIMLFDAETDEDLDRIAHAVRTATVPTLAAGSSGLSSALARCEPVSPKPMDEPVSLETILFVIGSRSAESRAQIDALRALGITLVPANKASENRSARRQTIVVTASDTPEPVTAGDMARTLAAAAQTMLPTLRPDALFLAGGETAEAVLRQLGTQSIRLTKSPVAGIEAGSARAEIGDIPVFTKAGGFGDPALLRRFLEAVRQDTQFSAP